MTGTVFWIQTDKSSLFPIRTRFVKKIHRLGFQMFYKQTISTPLGRYPRICQTVSVVFFDKTSVYIDLSGSRLYLRRFFLIQQKDNS